MYSHPVTERKKVHVESIKTLMRASSVQRWNMVATARSQSLAEHSFNVAIIACRIAELSGLHELVPQVMVEAINHDLTEVITGDIPTPTKKALRDAGVDLGRVFSSVRACNFSSDIDVVHSIVKLADVIEGCWFISSFGVGDHASSVEQSMVVDFFDAFIDLRHRDDIDERIRTMARHVFDSLMGGDTV